MIEVITIANTRRDQDLGQDHGQDLGQDHDQGAEVERGDTGEGVCKSHSGSVAVTHAIPLHRSSSRSRERHHHLRRSRSRSHSPRPRAHRSRSHSRSRSQSRSPHERRNSSSEKNKYGWNFLTQYTKLVCTVEPLLEDTPVIRTPLYQEHFIMFQICFLINLLLKLGHRTGPQGVHIRGVPLYAVISFLPEYRRV